MALSRDYGAAAPPRAGLRAVEPFVKLRLSVLFTKGLSPISLKLYLVICNRSWQEGWCSATQSELCEEVECCERTLRASLAELVERGLLISERPHRQQPAVYRPLAPEDIPPARLRTHPAATEADPQSGKIVHHSTESASAQSGKNVTSERQESAPLEVHNFAAPTLPVKTGPEDPVKTGTPCTTYRVADEPKKPSTNRLLAEVIDGIRAAGLTYQRNDRDGAAMRGSDASPGQVVECYLAVASGSWPEGGDPFHQKNLSVHWVINQCLNAYLARGVSQPRDQGRARGSYGQRITVGQPGAPVSSEAIRIAQIHSVTREL